MEKEKEPKIEAVVKAEEIIEKAPVDVEKFIQRKLKALNEMDNRAKAKALGERVLKNRR